MKKQILFLMVFVLATLASVNNVMGQTKATKGDAPQPTVCVTDALHPTAGVPYTYTLDATPADGTWMWYATKNTTFVTAAAIPADSLKESAGDLKASANYGKDGTTNSVSITWSEAVLNGTTYQGDGVAPNGTPTFVVGYFKANSPGCSDNIKIYELDPKPSFTVDILNLNPTTYQPDATNLYTYSPEQCVDVVQSATYTSAHQILYDYGTNYLYYEFVAANFNDYWVPTFALSGLDASQAVTYEYTYEKPSNWTATTTWNALVSGTTHLEVDPSVTSTKDGVSVYVRVTVKNNKFETLAAQTPVFALDGQNKAGNWDVVNSTCVDPKKADQDDKATQTITERPTVVPGTTSTTGPNTTLITKEP